LAALAALAGCSSNSDTVSCTPCSSDLDCVGGKFCRGVCVGPGEDPHRCPLGTAASASGASTTAASTSATSSTSSTSSGSASAASSSASATSGSSANATSSSSSAASN